jgi:hypothetical protein
MATEVNIENIGPDTGHDIIDFILLIITQYVAPAVAISGCINNVFIVMILSLPQYRKHVSCLYLRILAVIDSVTIVAMAIIMTGNTMAKMVSLFGEPFCAVISFVVNFTPELSSWSVVAITGIRFIAVVFPLQAAAWTTFKAAKIYCISAGLIFFTFAVPDLIYSRVRREDQHQFGCVNIMKPQDVFIAYDLSHTVVSFVLPFFVLLFLNSFIFLSMGRRKLEIEQMRDAKENKEDRNVMVMVMAVTLTFLVAVLPFVVHFLVWETIDVTSSPVLIKQRTFSYIISLLFYEINCSINFFLYFVTCKKFRQDIESFLLCRCFRRT